MCGWEDLNPIEFKVATPPLTTRDSEGENKTGSPQQARRHAYTTVTAAIMYIRNFGYTKSAIRGSILSYF